LFKRQWAFLYQNLNGKYRITSLNKSSAEFESLKKTSVHGKNYSNGVHVYFDQITEVELFQSDPEASDFYLPNGNFREKSFELLSYITNQRQLGDSSKYFVPAEELPVSETEGLGLLTVQGNCFGNIPPVAIDYIARIGLENQLKRILYETDRYPVVTLVGRGGIGKTTLALSVLHQLSNEDRFDLILWFSARDLDLKLEGPKPVKNSLLSEEDMAFEFVKLVGYSRANKSSEKIEYLTQQLSKSDYGKILFVLDNFETVQNPTELFKWLDTYVRNPNKVLITSRISKSFKADYPIEVYGMTDDEGRELIDKTAESFHIADLLTPEIKEIIFNEAQGHPYVIKILLGQIAKEGKVTKVERIMASQDDILIALFRRTYNTLTPAAKRVFLTLCSWRSLVPQVALEAALLREENRERINVEEAVEELRKSSFIDIIFSAKEETAFISVPLAAFLFGKGELEVSPMKIAILSDREFLQEFGVTQQSDLQNGIIPKIEKKFRVVANKISNGENSEPHIRTLEFLCRKFPYAYNYLYQLYVENGQYEKAREALREYLKESILYSERKAILSKLASLYKFDQDYLGEVNSLAEMCLLSNSTLEEVSETANIINSYLFRDETHKARLELDTDIKERLVRKMIDLMNSKLNTLTTATDYSRLAWLYMHVQDYSNAKIVVEKGLAKDFDNTHCISLAKRLRLYI
jgi:energy-coupling factor transporter ATP-binding protein EcfA2